MKIEVKIESMGEQGELERREIAKNAEAMLCTLVRSIPIPGGAESLGRRYDLREAFRKNGSHSAGNAGRKIHGEQQNAAAAQDCICVRRRPMGEKANAEIAEGEEQ